MKGITNKLEEARRNLVPERHKDFSDKLDSYLKWAPLFSVLALPATGIKMKNSFRERLLLLALSETILNAVVYPLKKLTHERRPNLSLKKNSFPSGHTATCFMGAEILQQELKDDYPAGSFAGYGLALTTGILRLLHKKHWVPDVVCGALIGLIAAKGAYALFNRLKEPVADQGNVFIAEERRSPDKQKVISTVSLESQ